MHTNEPLTILYAVNAKLPNNKAHGIQIVKTCEALARRGNEVRLIITGSVKDGTDIFSFYNIERNFSVVRLPVIDTNLFGHAVRFYVRSITYYACLYPFLAFQLLKGRLRHVRSVMYLRGETVLLLAPIFFLATLVWESHTLRGHKNLYLAVLSFLSGMVVITDAYKRDLIATRKIPAERITVARDAVDTEEFDIALTKAEARSALGLPHDATLVVYTGQLAAYKGVDTLLRTRAILSSEYHLVVVGGNERDVASYRKLYGTTGITFSGLVPHVDIPRYLKAADMLVLPDSATSDYGRLHTSPMKMFEYMASRRPILASRVPSLGEVLDEKNAMMFVPDDPDDLAKKIRMLHGDPQRAAGLADAAYETVRAFTWDKRAAIIDSFLRTL